MIHNIQLIVMYQINHQLRKNITMSAHHFCKLYYNRRQNKTYNKMRIINSLYIAS